MPITCFRQWPAQFPSKFAAVGLPTGTSVRAPLALQLYQLSPVPLSRSSAVDNLWTLDAARGVARIHHQVGLAHDAYEIVVGVVGHNQHAIVLGQIVQRCALHLKVILAAFADSREIRIVVADLN